MGTMVFKVELII